VDTIDEMVVPGPLAWAPLTTERQRRRRRWPIVAFVVALALPGLLTITLPYYAIAPGSARQVNDLIQAPKDKVYPPRGRVLLATVSLGQVKPLDLLLGWLDKDTEIVSRERILGRTPPKEYRQENLQLMDDSKQNATVAALRRLGYDVPEQGKGTLVVEVVRGAPVDGRLKPGDVITSIDGKPTPLVQQAIDAIRAHRPGDAIRLDVTAADGAGRVEQLAVGSQDGRPFLGVRLQTKDRRFDVPFTITIDSAGIGGPSAGLAFTLGLLDELTPGELTGGRPVAVTGTIDADGAVGEVGGVAQKTAAVRRAGAEYFLVPPGEYATARAHAGRGLTIVKVSTLNDALDALGRIGGDVAALGSPDQPVSRVHSLWIPGAMYSGLTVPVR
jgi:PDZ domain-containing protein